MPEWLEDEFIAPSGFSEPPLLEVLGVPLKRKILAKFAHALAGSEARPSASAEILPRRFWLNQYAALHQRFQGWKLVKVGASERETHGVDAEHEYSRIAT